MSWKSRFRSLHRWFALAASLPLIVVSVTGALLVFPEQTRRIVSGDPPGLVSEGPYLAPTTLIAAIEAELPEGDRIVRMHYPAHPGDLMTVNTEGHLVRIDPRTATVHRVSVAERDPVVLLSKIHVNLLAGTAGEWVVGLSAIALMVLCASGLRLWWPVGRWSRSLVTITLDRGWKRANYDLHRVPGIAFGALLLVITMTGATMAFWGVFAPIAYAITLSRPAPEPAPGPPAVATPTTDRTMRSADEILDLAMQRHPGLEPRRLYLPTGPETPYRVFLDPPGEHELRINEIRMNIDPFTGAVLIEEIPAEQPRGDRLLRWVIPLHFGTFGGLPTKLLYLPATLSPVLLAATGTLLWRNRTRSRRRARLVDARSASPSQSPALMERALSGP
ncbi:PepSY-associated TM helix domain-containing protein [Tautonia sp. JC769]|uniref:PepSY-associated TM helix domain-containing protein n=1 Tax=Tautonia sp. JC769 TaxID=3232135 RepID=UPI003458BD75